MIAWGMHSKLGFHIEMEKCTVNMSPSDMMLWQI